MVKHQRFDPSLAGALETIGVGSVGDHQPDFRLELAAPDGVDDRLQIGAGT